MCDFRRGARSREMKKKSTKHKHPHHRHSSRCCCRVGRRCPAGVPRVSRGYPAGVPRVSRGCPPHGVEGGVLIVIDHRPRHNQPHSPSVAILAPDPNKGPPLWARPPAHDRAPMAQRTPRSFAPAPAGHRQRRGGALRCACPCPSSRSTASHPQPSGSWPSRLDRLTCLCRRAGPLVKNYQGSISHFGNVPAQSVSPAATLRS